MSNRRGSVLGGFKTPILTSNLNHIKMTSTEFLEMLKAKIEKDGEIYINLENLYREEFEDLYDLIDKINQFQDLCNQLEDSIENLDPPSIIILNQMKRILKGN